MPYTPQQNGSAERENRTVVELMRSIFYSKPGLSRKLWAEAVNTVVYVLNRTGPTPTAGRAPYELWFGKEASVDHLKVFGTECFVHIPNERRKKLDKKSWKGFLVGYEGDHDGFRVWVPELNSLRRSRDVIFTDERLSTPVPVDVYCQFPEKPEDDGLGRETTDSTSSEACTSNEPFHMQLRDRSKLQAPVRYQDYALMSVEEPINYSKALESPDADKWKQAMEEEMHSLRENDVFELVDFKAGRRLVGSKWVFRVKVNVDGSLRRYKARLVAQGFSQRAGCDYNETYSPVARLDTIRIVLAISASERLNLLQFDVQTALLFGMREDEIYLKQPPGFEDGSGKVWKLKRSLYGLKQSPKCWNSRLVDYLAKFGLFQSSAEQILVCFSD